MILVDSSVWIDYFNGRITRKTGILDDLLGREPLLTGDLILIEVLQGFRDENDFHRGREILSRIPYMDMVGREIAIQSVKKFPVSEKKRSPGSQNHRCNHCNVLPASRFFPFA